ncbi:MAG: S-layer protein, partial [Firmicutes bacterium]|nr:S-layer protein [Bacillota bacterium]
MKKSLIVLLILVFSLSLAGTAFAAGNFVDVPTNHWAYASVNKLVKAGLVDGMSNGNFNGDKAITRYEMAIIVGKAMDNYNKADDANKAEIMKLVAEFAKELDKMGLRIAALEKSQSPISFSGSADV